MTSQLSPLQALELWKSYMLALKKLSADQAQLIEQENYADLIALLTHKQQLLDSMAEHRKAYRDVWELIRTQGQSLPATAQELFSTRIREITTLTEELLAVESRASTALSARKNEVQAALSAASSAQAAASAYDSANFAENRARVVWES
ncbi:hypothetical protein [Planctopirus hydrillae]|uniref:Flagellar biosynthesis protein FlgN n=1 Tax=Planctopirus hydrillae TaxID=1841610 RepID=A0A1C3ETJ2_9PLAN|nr:hypothetical protein [Planctopirus hydrillae]ODA36519.1 hypothetical protein A6X21_02215 [Planctopirus hydrillae]